MIILCADDYGLSPGVSRGILELCAARRLSATSALVTFDDWPCEAQHLASIRPTTATGLHLNLTLGKPLIANDRTSHLDRTGTFLPIGKLIIAALSQRLNANRIQQECSAQIKAFQQATGCLPDFIDGHQHVHALPIIRHGLIAAIAEFTWPQPPLIRVPIGRPGAALSSLLSSPKQAIVHGLSQGFASALNTSGLPFNHSFAGFSGFASDSDYGRELEAALTAGEPTNRRSAHSTFSQLHLVMCHPGYVDRALRQSGDPIVERRAQELDALMQADRLPDRIWHPIRDGNGAINWHRAMAT